MRRHYHVEEAGDHESISKPIPSFRKAISEAYTYVKQARMQGLWRSWHVDWHDPKAGYHRWTATTIPSIGDYTDTITVVPCETTHREVS